MKVQLIAVLFFTLWGSVSFSQSPAQKDLADLLAKEADPRKAIYTSEKALDRVLKTPAEFSAVTLYIVANSAFRRQRLEDSAFLYYAAQLRGRFDRECFTAKGKGGDSPFLLYAALSQQIGAGVNPTIMSEPKAFSKVMDRVKAWIPKASEEYSPGYEFTERITEKEAHEAVKDKRKEFIDLMSDLATLLNDKEYFAAYQINKAYNMESGEKQPTKEASDEAIEVMKRIEKTKKIQGFQSIRSK